MPNFILNIKNFLGKLKNIFSFKRKKPKEIQHTNKKFENYLENIDILDPAYEIIKETIEFCQESLYYYEKRIMLNDTLQSLVIRQQDLEVFNSFSKTDIQKLQNYIDTYKTVFKENTILKNQIDNYNKMLDYLSKYEKEVETAIKEIEYYEQRQAGLKRDIAYINGEREELIYSKEHLEQGLDFLYKFSIVLVCMLAIITFVLGVLKIMYNYEIFVPLAILAVFAIILGAATYIFQRKFRYELQRNVLLQGRAVELLNRTKALYVNCTGFLNYEYKKYKVRNSEMLKNNWDEYTYQKQISRRHIAMNNRTEELVTNITKMLQEKGIQEYNELFEQLINLISLEDKRALYRDVKAQKDDVEKQLEQLDISQEKLWGQLIDLQQKDTTEDNIISHIIEEYEQEVNKILNDKVNIEIPTDAETSTDVEIPTEEISEHQEESIE